MVIDSGPNRGPIANFLDPDLATRRLNSAFGIKARPETPSELSPSRPRRNSSQGSAARFARVDLNQRKFSTSIRSPVVRSVWVYRIVRSSAETVKPMVIVPGTFTILVIFPVE